MEKSKFSQEQLKDLSIDDMFSEFESVVHMLDQDMEKAAAQKASRGKYPVACLYRMRQNLLYLQKLGLQFRKSTIAYEKELLANRGR